MRWPSLRAALRTWERNFTVYRKRWMYALLPNFFEPVFYFLGMGIGVGSYVSSGGTFPQGYLAFLAPGLVAVSAMNGSSFATTYNVFVKLHFEKQYDAIISTRMNMEDVALGELLWATTRALIYGGAFVLVSLAFGVPASPWLWLAPFAIALIGFTFAAIGMTFTSLIDSIDLYSYYFTVFLTPLFLFSGVFFPLEERLSPALLTFAACTPLYQSVRLMRGLFSGQLDGLLVSVAYLAGLGFVLAAFALTRLRQRVVQ